RRVSGPATLVPANAKAELRAWRLDLRLASGTYVPAQPVVSERMLRTIRRKQRRASTARRPHRVEAEGRVPSKKVIEGGFLLARPGQYRAGHPPNAPCNPRTLRCSRAPRRRAACRGSQAICPCEGSGCQVWGSGTSLAAE